MLRQIDVEVGRSLRLLTVMAEGSGASRRGDETENLACGVVHRVPDRKCPLTRRLLHVRRISVDLSRRVPKQMLHPLHMGHSLTEGGEDEIRRGRIDSLQKVPQ